MKRITLALAAIGLSTGALAAYPAASDPTLVNIPQLPGGFFVGGMGAYVQPSDSNGDLDYASVNGVANANSSTSFFDSRLQNVEPSYDWLWGLNAGYIFPNTGNDVNLSYLHFSSSDTDSEVGNNNIEPTKFTVGGNDFLASSAAAKAEYDLNQVDLTAGQYINVGCRLVLHPNAGLRWAEVERKLNSTFSNSAFVQAGGVTFTQQSALNLNEQSNFSGIGPIAGLDASYYIGMGIGAVAHLDSALLIGNIDAKTNGVTQATVTLGNSDGTITATENGVNSLKTDNIRRLVPVTDMKLGLDYTYVFNNQANSDVTLELGWMASNYYNAVDRVTGNLGTVTTVNSPGPSATQTDVVSSQGASHSSDFGLEGPYASLVFHI